MIPEGIFISHLSLDILQQLLFIFILQLELIVAPSSDRFRIGSITHSFLSYILVRNNSFHYAIFEAELRCCQVAVNEVSLTAPGPRLIKVYLVVSIVF